MSLELIKINQEDFNKLNLNNIEKLILDNCLIKYIKNLDNIKEIHIINYK